MTHLLVNKSKVNCGMIYISIYRYHGKGGCVFEVLVCVQILEALYQRVDSCCLLSDSRCSNLAPEVCFQAIET